MPPPNARLFATATDQPVNVNGSASSMVTSKRAGRQDNNARGTEYA
jgi:hypothetical protein